MKKLLVIGAGFLQDFVIRKAVSMGYETLALDANPDSPGFAHAHRYSVIDIVDEKACLEYAERESIDGVITAATDFGVLSAAYIAEHMGLRGIKYNTAKLIKNKYDTGKRLKEHHVDDSAFFYKADTETDIGELAHTITYPVIVKPVDGSGSRGTVKADDPAHFMAACESAMAYSLTKCAVIEPFIEGNEYGVESIVVNGETVVLAVMKKWMTSPPYYAELGHAIPSGLSASVEQRIRDCVCRAVKTLGIDCGPVNMDLILSRDGRINIVDIGARMGGNLIGSNIIPYGTGIDYVGAIICNAVGDPVDLTPHEHSAVVTRLLTFERGVVHHLPDMNRLEEQYDVEIYHHLKTGMQVNEYHTNLDGCGYVVAKAVTAEEAERKAETVLDIIRSGVY